MSGYTPGDRVRCITHKHPYSHADCHGREGTVTDLVVFPEGYHYDYPDEIVVDFDGGPCNAVLVTSEVEAA